MNTSGKTKGKLSRRCPFCGSPPLLSLCENQYGRVDCTVRCYGCDVIAVELGAENEQSARSFAADRWVYWCNRMERAKTAGVESIKGRTCADCKWNYPDSIDRSCHCAPCMGTGVSIGASPVCGLFVPRGAETERNEYGLEPCLCGCRDVKVDAHWSGYGMGESCDLTIKCPQCGLTMDADDFGIKWNITMMEHKTKGKTNIRILWDDLMVKLKMEMDAIEKEEPEAFGAALRIQNLVMDFGKRAGLKEEKE